LAHENINISLSIILAGGITWEFGLAEDFADEVVVNVV